jgi:hypothetical protein
MVEPLVQRRGICDEKADSSKNAEGICPGGAGSL